MRHRASYPLLALALAVAAPAAAQQVYTLSGSHVRGAGVDAPRFPLAGEPCSIFYGSTTPPTIFPMQTRWPSYSQQAGRGNCIGGGPAAVVATAPGTGAALTVPQGFFQRGLPPSGAYYAPVPRTPMVIQLATSVAFSGPTAPAMLRANAWTTQAGRRSAHFTWCQGGTECSGTTLLVKNIAGPNRFGGTMRMLQTFGPERTSVWLTIGGGRNEIVEVSGPGARVWGGGYALTAMEIPPPGMLYGMIAYTSMGHPVPSSYLGPVPQLPRTHVGFPFTTGTVVVRRQGNSLQGAPVARTLTARGGDSITAGGARNISLVAGGLTVVPGGVGSPQLAQVSLLPEPGTSAGWLAGGAALMALRAWRRRR